MDELAEKLGRLSADPDFQRFTGVVVWLSAINGGFWLLARAGHLLDLFSELFWEELWGVFAIIYNAALAVFFAAIIFVAAAHGAPPKDLFWREACGFVILYFSLSAAYLNTKTYELDEFTRPGFMLGLAAFVLFAAFPRLALERPRLLDLIAIMKDLQDSWIGFAATALVTARIGWRVTHGGLSAFLFGLQPLLWTLGLTKLPPIRVRRRR